MRLFLDANSLFTAAHNSKGKAAQIFEHAKHGHWELVTSSYAIAEAERNLLRKYPSAVANLDSLLRHVGRAEHHPSLLHPPSLATKDRPIFQAALGAGATHLLTGDFKDFGEFMDKPDETFGIHILSVGAFIRTLADPGECNIPVKSAHPPIEMLRSCPHV